MKSVSDKDIWYFAYGSNMSIARKEDRTDKIRKSKVAKLDNYRFVFNKDAGDGTAYANIIGEEGAEVWGVVYLCNPEAIERLNKYEGVNKGHYRQEYIQVVTSEGEKLKALAYVAGHTCEPKRPREDYLQHILQGVEDHGLPNHYKAQILVAAGIRNPRRLST